MLGLTWSRFGVRGLALASLAALLSLALIPRAHSQQAIEDFYRGKQLDMVIGYSPGGTYDLYARLVARFLGNYIPGKPVIVPADTWLARQLPAGCGESFVDAESLTLAVLRIASDYDAYRRRVSECRSAWLRIHSPAELVKRLLGACPDDEQTESQRRAA